VADRSGAARLALLRGIGAFARGLPSAEASGGAPRLLVIRPDHLGDVLLTTAALRALRAREPDAEITALVGPWSAEVLRRNPDVDCVLVYPFPWFDRRPAGLAERYAAAGALAGWLRALAFERAYVLRTDHWWGAMAAALAAIPERIGYGVTDNRPFLTRALPPPAQEHVVRSALRLVAGDEAAAAPIGTPPTCFRPSGADRGWACATTDREARYVVVHPGASTALKRWPAERWGVVAEALRGEGFEVWLAGGPGEESVVDEVAGHAPKAQVVRPAPSLGRLGALFERAVLALGMDSAPMHLATAVGAPTVRMVGPADETLFGPWGDPELHVTVRAAGTAPDPTWFAGGERPHPTLTAIEPGQVLGAVDTLRARLT